MKVTVIENVSFPREYVMVADRHGKEYGIDLFKCPEAVSLKVGDKVEAERRTNSPFLYLKSNS